MADLALNQVSNREISSLKSSEYRRLAVGIELVKDPGYLILFIQWKKKSMSHKTLIHVWIFYNSIRNIKIWNNHTYIIFLFLFSHDSSRRSYLWFRSIKHLLCDIDPAQSCQEIQPDSDAKHGETSLRHFSVPRQGNIFEPRRGCLHR